MRRFLRTLMMLCSALLACSGCATQSAGQAHAPSQPAQASSVIAAPSQPAQAAATAPAQASGCDDFFQYCFTISMSGSAPATAIGIAMGSEKSCSAWAATGDKRILELPTVTTSGAMPITLALTRIGQYSGPGRYELKAVSSEGLPDMFPAIRVGERAFSNGEGSTAVVTIAADGSGSFAAKGLVELEGPGVTPDPNARLEASVQWTCKDQQ